MSKNDGTKSESDLPKKEEKKGLLSRVVRDVKNLAVGIVSLPAHFATNPVDMAGKTALIAASAIPVVGSFVVAAYAFKQSMRNEKLGVGSVIKSLAKGAVAGAIAGVPGAGPAIMTAYVATNIGEQVEQTVEATKRGGVPKTTLEVVRDKYKEGRENIKSLGDPEKRAEIGQKIKSSMSIQGIKDAVKVMGENIGALTSKVVEERTQKLAEKIKQDAPKPSVEQQQPSVTKPSIKTQIMNKVYKQVSKIRTNLAERQNQKNSSPTTKVDAPKTVDPFKPPSRDR